MVKNCGRGLENAARGRSLKHFHLRNDKVDLKGFQTKFESLFLQVSVTI